MSSYAPVQKLTKIPEPTSKPLFSKVPVNCVGPDFNYNIIGSSLKGGTIIPECMGMSTIDNNTIFVVQSDGNVVLYDKSTNKQIWATHTSKHGTHPYKLQYQANGSLILIDGTGRILWFSGANSKTGVNELIIQDKHVVSYNNNNNKNRTLWNSATMYTPYPKQTHTPGPNYPPLLSKPTHLPNKL